jgi:hypothetical protein
MLINKEFKICPKCQVEKPNNKDYFYLRKNSTSTHCWCKTCLNNNALERQRETKRKAVEYKGGKCVCCGYNRCIAALEFHHLDPSKKDFRISNCNSLSFESIKSEVDKCALVCCVCHREIHAKIRSLPETIYIC